MTEHTGSCHCGAVRFSFEAEITVAEVCNCSICARSGYLHSYVTPERFRLITGDDAMTDYRFGTRVARNLFCSTCGISAFRRARSDPNLIDVNLRCVEGLDVETLPIETFDGRNWEEAVKGRAKKS